MTNLQTKYSGNLPPEYLAFLTQNPKGREISFKNKYWNILSEDELLEELEMFGVGTAKNFECLKLYIKTYKEFTDNNFTKSNQGNIPLDRVEKGFVFAKENGNYLYFDVEDNFSVWIYHHDGGYMMKITDLFRDFIKEK